MDNIKIKNKFISRFNNKIVNNYSKSVNNNKCIGPCYPSNTVFYHPIYLTPQINDYISCPIFKSIDKTGKKIDVDECNKDDLTKNYKDFNIFDDLVQIANTPEIFLEQIYNIVSLQDVITFLNNSIDEMPIYSQKRVLECIFSSFIIDNNFPKELFFEKIQHVLKKIYNIDISVEKIQKKISSKKNIENIFLYFINKYSKK
jgi:hypothetical protein